MRLRSQVDRTYHELRSYSKMALRHAQRRIDRSHRARTQLITAHLDVPAMQRRRRLPGEVWAVSLVKNEVDVVPQSIVHLLEQGVDQVLVADNGSTDGTYEALQEISSSCPVIVARDRLAAFYQAEKVTLLAEVARRAGADWVVPFDADEFWFARGCLLADRLRTLGADVAQATLHNLFPTAPMAAVDRAQAFRLDTAPSRQPKVAYRTHRMAALGMGNHGVDRTGERWRGLFIAHLPWRSRTQLQRKATQGKTALDAGDLAEEFSAHWRLIAAAADEDVDEMWANVVAARPDDRLEWTPRGPFIEAPVLTWNTWDPDGLLERGHGDQPNG